MNWFPDWSSDTCQIGMRKLRHFANIFMVHLDFNEWNSKKIELNMIYCEIVHQIKGLVLISENKTHFLKNYWARPIFDSFSAPRTTRIAGILFNFDEAVVNLFLELLTTNFTNFDKLGVKLLKIEARIRILCQFSCKVKYEKAFGDWPCDWLALISTVLPDNLEITILGARSTQNWSWKFPVYCVKCN